MSTTLIVGCGLLGRRVGKILAERGDRVFGTTRKQANAAELSAIGIEAVVADVLDPSTLNTLPEVGRVLCCVGFDRSLGIPMRTVYVDGLRSVLGHIKGKPRVIYASSTGVYARNDGGWVDEEYPAAPRHEAGIVCLEAEELARSSGFDLCVLRFSGLYGPGRVMRKASLLAGEPVIGDPAKWLNVIQIDDAANVAVAALDKVGSRPLYVVSDDRPIPRSEFYSLAAECLSAPPPTFLLPEPGSPEARREESNKRASNRLMKLDLMTNLRYPDIQSGLAASL